MASEKVDFLVQQSDPCPEPKSSLKAGTAVTLNQSGSVTEVVHEETVLGVVRASDQQLFQDSTPACTIRSVRRQDGKLSQILVRAIFPNSEATTAPPAEIASSTQQEELEGTTMLPQSQLELLVGDENLRGMLRDERLQQQILAIDGAADREKALQQQFQNADFKAFTDKVLGTIAMA